MNKTETTTLLTIIKMVYPVSYRDVTEDMALATINQWHNMFKDVPYDIMGLTLHQYIKSNKFAPTIADFFEILKKLRCEAWYEAKIAKTYGDTDTLRRCMYIVEHTDVHRDDILLMVGVIPEYKFLCEKNSTQKITEKFEIDNSNE